MADNSAGRFSVVLLADRIHLVSGVAEIRWREWGHPPEPQALSWWVDAARREAGREELPVTFVATDQPVRLPEPSVWDSSTSRNGVTGRPVCLA